MLVADQKIKDLGNIPFGKPQKFGFLLTNESEDRIVIAKLVRSCSSCTDASINKMVLEPKESVEMKVVFTPGATGKASKKIQILHTVGKTPGNNLTVEFKAQVDD